jgi:hypothetical protein
MTPAALQPERCRSSHRTRAKLDLRWIVGSYYAGVLGKANGRIWKHKEEVL